MASKNFSPLLVLLLDPGFEIRDPGCIKIRIRDKHPGSATLRSPLLVFFLPPGGLFLDR
jgi:hypothetical protein